MEIQNCSNSLPTPNSRREFLRQTGMGLGTVAFGTMVADYLVAPARAEITADLKPRKAPLPAKAKHVIHIFAGGAPSHLDTFDYKPGMKAFAEKTTSGQGGVIFPTPFEFKKCGKSGLEISEIFPKLQEQADEMCVIRSMHSDLPAHGPAAKLMHTGSAILTKPCLGSWVLYGLGTESQDLPGFVTLISSGTQPSGGQGCWGSGFLPSVYQGVQCRSKGDPVLFANDPPGMTRDLRRATLDALKDLNQRQQDELGHAETVTRIAQYELAFRMQTSVPDVMDISKESAATLEAYGAKPGEASFANNCLLARRLVEKGVRFVHLFDWGWDFHGTNPREDIRDGLTKKMAATDKPAAALIKDLKQRGLLDDTLIVWGGEFGRTPFREGRTSGGSVLGRDHYPDCYSVMLAGGGVKGGFSFGETDEMGFAGVKDKVHVHDLQATILHLLGFDHERLTYRFQGRDYRLTDVHGEVVKAVLT